MNKLFLLSLFLALSAQAADSKAPAPDNEEGKMQVELDPTVYQFKKLPKSKNAVVKKKKKPAKNIEHAPQKAAREAVFDKVKELGSFVSKYDELEKDLLYIRARSQKLPELKKDYPAFPEKILASLQNEIQKAEAKQNKD